MLIEQLVLALIENWLTILFGAFSLVVMIVTIYKTTQFSIKSVQEDIMEIRRDTSSIRDDVSFQKEKDVEHDIKFAEMEGEIRLLTAEQKNLREYAINGIQRVEDAINRLNEYLMGKKNG